MTDTTKILVILERHEKLLEEGQKMLRAVINGQSSNKEELLNEIKKVKIELTLKMDDGFKKVNDRLDKQGASLAYLEDDIPTLKDFNLLKKKS